MSERCLLVRTKDNRKFLTFEENLPSLIEFAKTFKAQIFSVECEKCKPLKLNALASALCNQDYEKPPQCEVLEKIFPEPNKNRQKMRSNAQRIRKFIMCQMLEGKTISLSNLRTKYKSLGLTDPCLCNHLSSVRKALIRDGYQIKKVCAGTYAID